LKVALVLHHARPTGGQDRYGLELARRLSASCDLDLITFAAEGGLPAAVAVRRVPGPSRPLLAAAPWFRRRAAALVGSGRYDLVHSVGGALPGATLITAQFCHAEWTRLDHAAGPYQRLVGIQSVAHEREAFRHPGLRAVIAVSRRTAEAVNRHYGPLSSPPVVIPNGVDLGVFAPRTAPRPEGPYRLLLVGAYWRKGLDTAIRALAAMRTPALLTAVGAGRRRPYLDLARTCGVEGKVELLPPTGRVEARYAAADAFVLPTRYDPFGMVIAEAMACGLPVVTSAAAGAADFIEDGRSGYVITDPEDAGAFARALDHVLSSEASRVAMGAAAREAVSHLTWDMVAQRTLDVYRSLA
jgi:UDP-glucose:(heptosyl)LPS alpha-1,3-glucosyltransferase